jgi:hypothetical protein
MTAPFPQLLFAQLDHRLSHYIRILANLGTLRLTNDYGSILWLFGCFVISRDDLPETLGKTSKETDQI